MNYLTHLIFINFIYLASGLQFNILNNCNYKVPIYSHEGNKFINKCELNQLESCTIEYEKIESGLIKTTMTENATLIEFTINDLGMFYDISVVPPGSGICYSYDECFNISKKTSYNIPVRLMPDVNDLNERCKMLECLNNQCEDAYLYPFDDLKTHYCNVNNNDNFNIIYCPYNIEQQFNCS